jgi:hypothetical protein
MLSVTATWRVRGWLLFLGTQFFVLGQSAGELTYSEVSLEIDY